MMKKFYAQGGVDDIGRAIEQEFATGRRSSSTSSSRSWTAAAAASEVDKWLGKIGKFMVEVGTLPQAPDAKTFVTDEYLRMVAAIRS